MASYAIPGRNEGWSPNPWCVRACVKVALAVAAGVLQINGAIVLPR